MPVLVTGNLKNYLHDSLHIIGIIVGVVWRGDLVSDSGLEHSVGIVALDFVVVSRFRFNTPWVLRDMISKLLEKA